MSRKNALAPIPLIVNESMATSITSPSIEIQWLDNVCVQLVWTGTPTGTFSVEGSLDQVSWAALILNPTISAAGSADNALIDLNQLSFPYIRVVYTASSGTGTLNALLGAKMI